MFLCNRNRQLMPFFAVFLGLVLGVSCQKKDSSQPSPAGTEPISAPAPTPGPKDQGASSGGGGYVTKNSKRLLEMVVSEVAEEIKSASPFLFKDLPEGWDQHKLSDVLKNIRMNSTKDVQRDSSDLLFNYGSDEKGPYIEALRPFFLIYGSVPLNFMDVYGHDMYGKRDASDSFKATVLDLRLKVLHEMSHLLGKNEKQAEEYSLELLRKLEEDFYICGVPKDNLVKEPNVLWVSPTEMSWVLKSDGGGQTNCFGPKPGCVQVFGFNWIRSNNWLYHQSKNKMFRSYYTITYYSHLDPQPFETMKEEWRKENLAPGVRWAKTFDKAEGMTKKSIMNQNSVEYSDELNEKTGKLSEDAIAVKADFEVNAKGVKIFKSASVNVPLMSISMQAPAEVKSMYGNPAAPLGKYTGGSKDYPMTCEYFGTAK
jgi:hypothetical protein